MSDGMNAAFKKNPVAFMRQYPMDIPYFLRAKPVGAGARRVAPLPAHGGVNALAASDRNVQPAGVYEFDIELDAATGAANLVLFADRAKASTWKSNKLKGYWLPWHTGNPSPVQGVTSVTFATLDASGADYLFTSALGGCRIVISATGFHHVAGDMPQAQRAVQTERVTGGGRARAFSSTTGDAYGELAFMVGYRTGRFPKSWHFVAQEIDIDPLTRRYTVGAVKADNQLYAIGV